MKDVCSAIRPFEETDRPAIVAIDNRDRPPYLRYTAEDWATWERSMLKRGISTRLVVGSPAIAYLDIVYKATEGVCQFELLVAHEHRQQGIGNALYEYALDCARKYQAHTLEVWFYRYTVDAPAVRFLHRRDFIEHNQSQVWYRDLSTFDISPFKQYLVNVEQQGIRLLSYPDLPDTLENRRKLFDLLVALHVFPAHRPFENWLETGLMYADWATDVVLIAELNSDWIGLSSVSMFNRCTHIARTPCTGILPAYRDRGIATALKVRVMERAKHAGYHTIFAVNRLDNEPMLAVNRRLGFVPGPVEQTYHKVLPER